MNKRGYFFGRDNLPWQDKSISADEETRPEDCLGYDKKTVEFSADTAGKLTILVDTVGDGDFKTYHEEDFAAAPVLFHYIITRGAVYIKLKYSVVAVVTAKYIFEGFKR